MMKFVLLIATKTDPASVNIANNVLRKFKWNTIPSKSETQIYQSVHNKSLPVFLWFVNQCLLTMDFTDKLFLDELNSTKFFHSTTNASIDNILFISRHSAASGALSLTVHPVGIPWLTDCTGYGGVPGKCSPPNIHIASLYRQVLSETKARGLDAKFQVTLEATHHGPYVEVPACFVEIGSDESEWSNVEAGDMWSDILGAHLGLQTVSEDISIAATDSEGAVDFLAPNGDEGTSVGSGSDDINVFKASQNLTSDAQQKGLVVVTLGGGHYVPKTNDMARFGDGLYTGHSLTTYALKPYLEGTVPPESAVPGGWKGIIQEGVESTKLAFPDTHLMIMIDKGAFNAEQRGRITEYLDKELCLPWTIKTADVKKVWEQIMSKGK